MARIISIHSFRGGTGKSNLTANLAVLTARKGRRVGIVDTDIQSPGIHVLFGLDESTMRTTLNDYLWGRARIEEAAYPVAAGGDGALYLIPSSLKIGEITRVLKEGYDVDLLNDSFHELVQALDLDDLFIDTHPGLNEETLVSISISDALAIVMRMDQQDYLGTGVTVEVARRLAVPDLHIIVNKVPAPVDVAAITSEVGATYNAQVAGVLPHSDEMMRLMSAGVFAEAHPTHPLTDTLRTIAQAIAPVSP
jgi:MinD-like ATPase involved in chromosome partitioning or flagellar assembly